MLYEHRGDSMIDLDRLDELGELREYISMPICNGCKNKDFDENGRICVFREKVISDDLQSKNCV